MILKCDFFVKSSGISRQNAAVGKLVKPPVLQTGHCGFDPRLRYYYLQIILNGFDSRSYGVITKRGGVMGHNTNGPFV